MTTGTAHGHDRYVVLATLGDPASAHLCAARLESEGIEARVHGEGLSPYRVTVGGMAATQIWVLESRLAEARAVMLAAEVDHLLEADPAAEGTGRPGYQIVALVLTIVVLAAVARAVLWLF